MLSQIVVNQPAPALVAPALVAPVLAPVLAPVNAQKSPMQASSAAPLSKQLVFLVQPKSLTVVSGSALEVPVAVDAAVSALSTSYNLLPVLSKGSYGLSVLEGPIPVGGAFQIPLAKVKSAGKYAIKVTRIFSDGSSVSSVSNAFDIRLLSWEAVAGTYEGLIADKTRLGSVDGAAYRGFISFSIARGGGVSGRLNYDEAVDVSVAPRSCAVAYKPVTKALLGSFTASSSAPLKFVFTPAPNTQRPGDRQVVSAELDFQKTPASLRVTVTDNASQTSIRHPEPLVCIAEGLSKATDRADSDKTGGACSYILSAQAPENGKVLVQVTPLGKVTWVTRLASYTGGGSASLRPVDAVHAVASLYEARSSPAKNMLDSVSLLGQLVFGSEGNGAARTCGFDPSVLSGRLEKRQSRVNQDGTVLSFDPNAGNSMSVELLEFNSAE